MDDTVSGHVQISGQSCYCATEICNHPQNTRSFKFTSGPNILNGNTVNDPSWQPSQSNINVDLNQDRTDRTGQPEFNRQTPLSQSNTHLNQIHPANLSSRMAVCSIFLTSLLMVTSIF